MERTKPLIEQLRRVDELAFLNWETYEEDLMKRLLIPSVGFDRPLNQNGGPYKPGRYRFGVGPMSFSAYREFRANEGTEECRPNGQDDGSSPKRNGAFANPALAGGEARVTDEEVLLGVAKREARRRAQRDLYIY